MPPRFDALARRVDNIVDDQWGERVRFRPQGQADEYSALGPDPDRPVSPVVVGVYTRPKAEVQDTAAGNRASSDLFLTIQDRFLPPYELKSEDLVEFLDREGMLLQISYLDPDATGRTKIHLLRK